MDIELTINVSRTIAASCNKMWDPNECLIIMAGIMCCVESHVLHQSYDSVFRLSFTVSYATFPFNALILLVGHQEEHPGCKNWVIKCWHGYVSGARCEWFAYSSADGHCHAVISYFISMQIVWCWLIQVVLEKRLLNGYLSVFHMLRAYSLLLSYTHGVRERERERERQLCWCVVLSEWALRMTGRCRVLSLSAW